MTIQTDMPITVIPENLKLPTEFQTLKVAVYARVRTKQEEQYNSLEAQTNAFIEIINSNPFGKFAGIYSETGSGKRQRIGLSLIDYLKMRKRERST